MLFVDLVGFTPLSEGRDPEEVRELLSRYFELARTIIGRYGGTVEKFIGDAVMAVWGTLVVAEGDAERAVRAGLDLVAAVGVLGSELAVSGLTARAGVVTGEVAVTLGATGEGMVAGDAVNTAARVQGVATSGSVWVDSATRRSAVAAITFDDVGEHLLKGKAGAEGLWRAVRVVSGAGGSQRVDGLEAPLVGRDPEFRTIKELFHASADRRAPRLVVVSGAAGVGKSRLGWEFEKYIDGLADTVVWHRGRCLSYGDGVAFWALAEIVRQRFGIAEEDSAQMAGEKLAEGLVRFVPDSDERAYVAARLGRLLGVDVGDDGPGVLPREELFAGWRLLFERLAGVAPVVLVIEDAHHADPGLLDFIDHLVDWVRDLPVFVLVFARPELVETRAGFGVGRNRAMLTVDPLDLESMDALVDALVPGLPVQTRGLITAQARGVALFALETVRSLIDRDLVVRCDGVYRLVGDVDTLTVPDSLHALLAARLDALEPAVRALVADASVVGSTFPAEALIAVSSRPDDEVRAGLTELVRRDVLEISVDPLSPQRGTYRFTQEMLRQVAYGILGRRDRKTRHLTVAAHLREVFPNEGEEVAEVIARHYLDAIAAGPDQPDVAAIRPLAIAALVQAAERSLRSGAPGPAAQSYNTAAQQTELTRQTDTAAATLWEKAATAAVTAGDLNQAVDYAERAQAQFAGHGDLRSAARAQTVGGKALRILGRQREARTRLTAALDALRPNPDADTVEATLELAAIETFTGGLEADRMALEALALGQALDIDAHLLVRLFIVRGLVLNFASRCAEAAAHFEYAVRAAERAGDGAGQALGLLNLADVLLGTDPVAAAAAAHMAAEHARRVGDVLGLTWAVNNEVAALLLMGDWARADDALRYAVDVDNLSEATYLAETLALTTALRGDAAAAAAFAGGAAARTSEDPQDKATMGLCDALIAVASNRPNDALSYARHVLEHALSVGIGHIVMLWAWPLAVRAAHDLADVRTIHELLAILDEHPIGHLPPLLRAERDLARARLTAGGTEGESARQAFREAIVALRKAASPFHLAHGLLDQAQYHMADAELSSAATLTREARAIGLTLRCPPLVDRASAITTAWAQHERDVEFSGH